MWLLALKKFWPFIVGALLLLAIYAWHRDKVNEAVTAERVRIENEQAEVIAKVKLENEKRESAQALDTAKLSTRLEVLTSENTQLAATVSELSRTSQLCLRDKVRRNTAPANPESPSASDGAAKDTGAVETLGEAVTGLIVECQRSIDKLVTLQDWIRSLKANGY